MCADEQLVEFRGRCPFRFYMKNKFDRHGIKYGRFVKTLPVMYEIHMCTLVNKLQLLKKNKDNA